MSNENEERVVLHHHHIDNGGVTTTVYKTTHEDGELANVILEHEASFYGYTEHSFRINNVSPGYLRKLASVLLVAADKIESS